MFSLKKQPKAWKARSSGFTIVELLIVIVVIGILATLVIVTFSGIQQKGRNSQRQTDINAIASHVEAFYAEKGFYPTFGQLSDGTWRTTNIKGLDAQALVDPKGNDIDDAAAAAGTYTYSYVATRDDGTTACAGASATADDNLCTKFTLSANLENNNTPYQKKSN